MAKNRKTIAFFLPSLEGGGTERNTINLLKHLDQDSYKLSVVVAEKKGDFLKEVPEGIPIVNLQTRSKAYLAVFLRLRKYLKKHKPDILVSAFPHFNVMCLAACALTKSKTKIVVTEHVGLLSLPKNASSPLNALVSRYMLPFFLRRYYPKASAIICVSDGVASDLSLLLNKDILLRVIHNPIDTGGIGKLSLAEAPDLKNKTPYIVMAGRLVKEKDYPTAFAVLLEVRRKIPAKLVILGRGAEEKKLKSLAEKMELSEQVFFLGFKENPYPYIKNAFAFMLSSSEEGFGNVLLEAMACGTPVVSTDCPFGPAEIIQHGVNGLLVPVKDFEGLAEGIIKIAKDPQLALRLTEGGLKRAEDFSAGKIAKEYEDVFETI